MGSSILLSSVCGHFYVILYECGVKLTIMAEQVVEFPSGGYKISHKNQHTQKKSLNFENWVNEEVSKSDKI